MRSSRTCRRPASCACANTPRPSAICGAACARARCRSASTFPPDFERRRLDRRPAARAAARRRQRADDREHRARVRGDAAAGARRACTQTGRPVFEVRTEYNPEKRTAVQIVPALIGVILTHDHDDVHRRRDRARARARQPRAADHDAGQLARADARQARAVRVHRPDPDHAGACCSACCCSTCRSTAACGRFYFAALLFIAATLTLGLLASTLAQTQMQAFQMSFFVLLPSILLSGFVFPFDGMPQVARWIAQLLPLTHFVELVRGIVLRGAGAGRAAGSDLQAARVHGGRAHGRHAALPQAARLIRRPTRARTRRTR